MRAMIGLVVGMGVLIVAGVAVVAVTIVGRMAGGHGTAPAVVTLDEPAGTRIAGVAGLGERLAVLLQGGGPDRVVVVDGRGGVRLGR